MVEEFYWEDNQIKRRIIYTNPENDRHENETIQRLSEAYRKLFGRKASPPIPPPERNPSQGVR